MKNLKKYLFVIAVRKSKGEIVLKHVKELIESIFDKEDENKINWDVFLKEYNILVSNDSSIRSEIISNLVEGDILSFYEAGNYEVLIPSSSGLGKENAIYTKMGQKIFFLEEKDAVGFRDALNKKEGEEAEAYHIQLVTR